ncbi:hypothetical protein N8633_00575 [bacterium]|jgi:hypothetical protein|nr:hypothetical protein [Verrucomicrobiota bacterium]MDA7680259.1 hypothetical protein [bacterium]
MEDRLDCKASPLVFEIEFRKAPCEWILIEQEPLVPFDLRFRDPEPGVQGAISYARFVGRKTGGLIRIVEPGIRPRIILFGVDKY